MTKHKHADLIHAWAEGAEIQQLDVTGEWVNSSSPYWTKDATYRIKPKEPEWWENIPKQGVLCWVSDDAVEIIIGVESDSFITRNGGNWNFTTPLTNEEIKQFLR